MVIEPKLSTQWFLKMSEMAQVALKAVMDDEVEFHPKKFKNVYRHWMENVKDWCISRQLWCVITSYSIHYTKLYEVKGNVVAEAPAVTIALPDFTARGGDQFNFRITSYNVCYTKLLRH